MLLGRRTRGTLWKSAVFRPREDQIHEEEGYKVQFTQEEGLLETLLIFYQG